jgi:hypothetical protein
LGDAIVGERTVSVRRRAREGKRMWLLVNPMVRR